MKKEIYENPKVEIVDLGTEDAICDVVCASLLIEKPYSGFHRYDNDENLFDKNSGVVDYGESPFGGSSNRGF